MRFHKKKIAVTGGKGGTGKSTFSVLYSLFLAKKGYKVLLVDLDVECPNDFLLLGLNSLNNDKIKTYRKIPKINELKCKKCGLCVKKCQNNAIIVLPNKKTPVVNEELCSGCGVCEEICPQKAIKLKKKINGNVFLNNISLPKKNNKFKSFINFEEQEEINLINKKEKTIKQKKESSELTLITGRSLPGVKETNSVVKQTRQFAEKMADEYDVLIFDSAAGIHCNVISAIENVDQVLAVTEPTQVGKHDLKKLFELTNKLKSNVSVVINRYKDNNQKQIKEIENLKKPILFKIKYSQKLAKAYSQGNFIND